MDRITLTQQNRLFWLGRYAERVYRSTEFMMDVYDSLIDRTNDLDYRGICSELGIPCDYEDSRDFCVRYLFDASAPGSVRSAAEMMLGNGMELRSTLKSRTLAYLQMAISALNLGENSDSPCVALQWVLDDIMAFRGSFDDSVAEEYTRNTLKAGKQIERLSLILRTGERLDAVNEELNLLLFRVRRSDLKLDAPSLDVILARTNGDLSVGNDVLLQSVESLVQV